jgi:hypothetical protein
MLNPKVRFEEERDIVVGMLLCSKFCTTFLVGLILDWPEGDVDIEG